MTEIVFQKKNLIFGANDVGKTNLLYALRLLFDKTISDSDLELNESDYNAYSGSESIEITATLSNITEDCLLSIFGGCVKDGKSVIRYTNQKHEMYKLYWGFNETTLTEISSRQYLKRLNMQCVNTNRNLFSFLTKERKKLLQLAKERLTEEEVESDSAATADIQSSLDTINSKISALKYISTSLEQVNSELGKLSVHNQDLSVQFVAGDSDADRLLDNLALSYSTSGGPLSIGGDGRNNQIFLASWIAKQNIQANIDHVTIYAIEEPEAHLHPHQQRKLSSYIQDHFDDQIFITSHSPQIASKFNPFNMIRLFQKNKCTLAACGGCSLDIKTIFDDFGHRLNALSAEIFFSDGVFLVEGTSEVLFYSAMAKAMAVDLDRYNISILSVEGIGFKPYVAICEVLNIPWVLRTDNDIFSKPNRTPTHKYYAGITRVMGIIELFDKDINNLRKYWTENKCNNEWPKDSVPPQCAKDLNACIKKEVALLGIFLSNTDLESDLANSLLLPILKKHYHKRTVNTVIKAMQNKKATNMLTFLQDNQSKLSLILEDDVTLPLKHLIQLVEERISLNEGERTN